MAARAFISYCHADEQALVDLHKHLINLRRGGVVSTWFDHDILGGGELDEEIKRNMDECSIFLMLVSPDYLASEYCYRREFEYVLSRRSTEPVRIMPIIVEPCDWLSTPIGKFKALPKDGQPLSHFKNRNDGYVDIVREVRRVLGAAPGSQDSSDGSSNEHDSSPGLDSRKLALAAAAGATASTAAIAITKTLRDRFDDKSLDKLAEATSLTPDPVSGKVIGLGIDPADDGGSADGDQINLDLDDVITGIASFLG